VSPSWRDSLRIGLCPDRVVFARYGRGLRPKLVEKGVLPVTGEPGAEPWQGAVAALPQLLREHAPRSALASLVLSGHFVRYLALGANDGLSGRGEWREYALHCFEKTYGARALAWDIQVAEAGARRPRLASAIDRALLDEAVAAFKGSRARLESIEPYLATAFNRALPAAKGSSFWFVLQEPGRWSLGLVREGIWQSLRSRRANGHDEVERMVERESALLADGEPCRDLLVASLGEDQIYAMVCA
jgi:hypothetical protein